MAEQNYETNGTMRREWTRLLEVPLNNRERQWLQERLEVLSVEEESVIWQLYMDITVTRQVFYYLRLLY